MAVKRRDNSAGGSGEPRYQHLARTLAAEIRKGEYPVGSLLPTEIDLASARGVSRHTVRAALKRLEEYGMVSRRAGVGTRVEFPSRTSRYRQSLDSIGDLVQFGERHRRIVGQFAHTVLDIDTAAELGCTPGSRWLWAGSVRWDERYRPPTPVCWTDNYIDPAYQGIEAFMRDSQTRLICDLIEERHNRRAVSITQTVRAASMPAEPARELQVRPDSPAILIVRQYLDEMMDTFIATRSLHPEGRFALYTKLDRSD